MSMLNMEKKKKLERKTKNLDLRFFFATLIKLLLTLFSNHPEKDTDMPCLEILQLLLLQTAG